MATFTITASNTNIDSLVGRTGQDTYNINAGQLVIDEDSRFGLNANTSATMGPITTSATLGGEFIVNATKVRLIPYDTGTGNVPTYNTTISQGSASGLLIGVYSALNVAPTTPGSAMPASGFIKIKQWNSVAYTTGALTGISANATGADRVGWIEVVGNEQASTPGLCTFNGMGNPNTPQFTGDWYEIGTTPGSPARTDTYQIPTNGNTCIMPGVWVEKSSGSNTYEFYATTTDTATSANVATDIRRGKYCWISTGGVLRFGHDGTNSTGGHVPGANCKIRTGNIFLTMAPNTTPTVNSLNATLATRYRFGGTSLPDFTMTKTTCNWYAALTTHAKIILTDSSFVGSTTITQAGEKVEITRCGWGAPINPATTAMLDFVQCAYGADIIDSYISYGNFGASSRNILRSNLSLNLTLTNCELGFTGTRSATTNYGISLVTSSNITTEDCIIAGTINHSSGSNINFIGNNEFWFDHASVVNTGTSIAALFTLSGSIDVMLEDFTFPILGQLPRAGLLSTTNGVRNTLRNIGSYASPIDFRLYTENDATWSRSGTTATVTTASAHGMSTGHRAYVLRSDSTTAITVGLKDLTITGSNTFTFTCLNAGATSGVLSFYGSCYGSSTPIDVQSTNTEATKIHNVHLKGTTGAVWGINSTDIDTEFKNYSTDSEYSSHASIAGTNTVARSIQIATNGSTPSATLGTHFQDIFIDGSDIRPDASGVSWTRSAGTITVTSPNHGLYTGQVIQTYGSSNEAGATQRLTTAITVINKNTFTYTGASTGATSGTISYRSPSGMFIFYMCAPIPETASQAVITAGTPAFTGQGSLAAFNIGDQVVFETPDYILGHNNFETAWPALNASGGSPISNTDIEYQIDRGSGFSAWKNMHVKRTSGAGTSGAYTITVNSTTGIAVGDYVWHNSGVAGLGAETQVVSVDSSTQLTLSVANTATFSSATIAFGQHPNETTFPSTGIKLKVRLTTTAAYSNAITSIQVFTNTTSTTRARLYAQDVETVSFTISGLPTGTTVALYDNTDTLLQREDNILTGSFVYNYVHSGTDFTDNYYVIWHTDYVPYKSDLFDLTATDLGLSYTPVDDPIYDAAHDDRYTIDFANKRIIMDTGETQYDVPGAYSHWKDNIFLSNNFIYDFAFTIKGGVDYATPKAIPPFTALINSWKIRPDEANHTLTVENGILYVEGGGDPFVDTLGAYTVRINYSQPVEVLLVSTGSGVLPSDITDIANAVQTQLDDDFAAIPTATENAVAVWSDSDTYNSGEKGKLLADAEDSADTAANR